MTKTEIIDWVHQEFFPVSLATPDETLNQIVDNTIRYWNTHSSMPLVKMYGANYGAYRLQLEPDYKNVVKIYPSTNPDWVLNNYPVWSLLGITIIDNLTSDLVMLSESYRNYKYYIGTDFNWKFIKSDDPKIGGAVYYSNLPSNTTNVAVVGTKRIINGDVQVNLTGNSGTLDLLPIESNTVTFTDGTTTFTDDGNGVLTASGYTGTIDYTTGAWTVTGWGGTGTKLATYTCYENVKSEYMLGWLLPYIKSLVKMVEGNTLRKTDAIGVKNDGQTLFDEGKFEKEELEKKLATEGRWMSFARKF